MRDLVFISHANPEDNEFTLWLALRLATMGYPVWTDLTKLLGGERFWDDIEKVIRERAIKFLFVLSKDSNSKQGPKDELHVAKAVQKKHGIKDFIIPLKIDNLLYDEINIQINPLNAINFTTNWAAGLEQLIEKLEKDEIGKKDNFNAEAVVKWWSETYSPGISIEESEEEYLSNEFKITSLPEEIFFHNIDDRNIYHILNQDTFPFPFRQHKNYIVSFADPELIQNHAKIYTLIKNIEVLKVQDLLDGKHDNLINKYEFNKLLTGFLSTALEKFSRKRGLSVYYQSGREPCLYFNADLDKQVNFEDLLGKKSYRYLYSYSETKEYYWHFGCIFKPILFPNPEVNVLPAVLFSDDGKEIWDSAKRLHRKRRSHCKRWYNKDWGDRIKAAIHWLADGKESFNVPLSQSHSFSILSEPTSFISPIRYEEPERN